jgi:hypothetical protein
LFQNVDGIKLQEFLCMWKVCLVPPFQ